MKKKNDAEILSNKLILERKSDVTFKNTQVRNHHTFYDKSRIIELWTKNNVYKWQCVFRIKTISETLRACRDCFWGNVPRRRLSFCRRSGRCGRTISPVGIRSIRRRILRLSQYSITSTVIVRIVWVPVELRADHRRQSQKDLDKEKFKLDRKWKRRKGENWKKNYQRFYEHSCSGIFKCHKISDFIV